MARDTEIRLDGSKKAREGDAPSAPPRDWINDLVQGVAGANRHVLLEGQSGSGKSLLARHIAFERMKAGEDVHVVDQHSPEAWGGAKQVFQGEQAGHDAARFMFDLLGGRKREASEAKVRGEVPDFKPLTLVFSDFARLMRDTPELRDEFKTLLTEARKFRISVVADTTALTGAASGIKGIQDVVQNFGQRVKLFAPTAEGGARSATTGGERYDVPLLPDYQERRDNSLVKSPQALRAAQEGAAREEAFRERARAAAQAFAEENNQRAAAQGKQEREEQANQRLAQQASGALAQAIEQEEAARPLPPSLRRNQDLGQVITNVRAKKEEATEERLHLTDDEHAADLLRQQLALTQQLGAEEAKLAQIRQEITRASLGTRDHVEQLRQEAKLNLQRQEDEQRLKRLREDLRAEVDPKYARQLDKERRTEVRTEQITERRERIESVRPDAATRGAKDFLATGGLGNVGAYVAEVLDPLKTGIGNVVQGIAALDVRGVQAGFGSLVGTIPVVGSALAGFGGAVFGISDSVNQTARHLSQYSATLAAQQAEFEIRDIERDIERADRMGEQIAEAAEARREFDEKWQEFIDTFAKPVLAVLTSLLKVFTFFLSVGQDTERNTRRATEILDEQRALNFEGIGLNQPGNANVPISPLPAAQVGQFPGFEGL